MLRDQFPDLGYEIVGNIHYAFGGLNASLVLHQGVFLGLFFVVGEYSSHLLLVPSDWRLGLAHCCSFFLMRRRMP